jgi:hypothetical protein
MVVSNMLMQAALTLQSTIQIAQVMLEGSQTQANVQTSLETIAV